MQLPIWFWQTTQTTLAANAFLSFCCTLICLWISTGFIFVTQTIFLILKHDTFVGWGRTHFSRSYSMTPCLTTCYNVLCMCCLHTMFSLENWHEPCPFQRPCQSFYGNHFFLSIVRSRKLKIFHNIFAADFGMASLEKLQTIIFHAKLDHFTMNDVHQMWMKCS